MSNHQQASWRLIGTWVGYLAAGAIVAVCLVLLARALGASRALQQTIAFLCLAGALVVLVVSERLRPADPVAAMGAVVALAVAGVGALSQLGPIQPDPGRGCILSEGSLKGTVTSDRTPIFSQATPISEAKGLLLSGCRLRAEAYCFGPPVEVFLEPGLFDTRWLKLSDDEGYLSAGQWAGVIPSTPRETCPGGLRSVPSTLSPLRATLNRKTRHLTLLSTAPDVAMIGYSMRVAGGWRRIGWDVTGRKGAIDVLVPTGLQIGGVVAATTCMAFRRPAQAPTRTTRVRAGSTSGMLVDTAASEDQPVDATPEEAGCDSSLKSLHPAEDESK